MKSFAVAPSGGHLERGLWAWLRGARWLPALLIGVIGVGLSLTAFQVTRNLDDARVIEVLKLRADWRALDIEHKLLISTEAVQAMAAFIATQKHVDRQQFERFTRLSQRSGDVMSTLSWAPFVISSQRDAFIAAARQAGAGGFEILDRAPDGRFVSAPEREEYLPLLFLSRRDGLPGQVGMDVLSFPGRRPWIAQARDLGQPIATQPMQVPSGSRTSRGYVVYWPIYETEPVPATVDQRREKFRGLVFGLFDFERVLPSLILNTPEIVGSLDFLVASPNDPDAPQLIATYTPSAGRFIFGAAANAAEATDLTLTRSFSHFGQKWILISRHRPEVVADLRSNAPLISLVSGLLFTLFFSAYLWREGGRRALIEATVAERTAELSLANSSLSREIEERRRSERAARESEEQLNQAQHLAHMGNIHINLQTEKVDWSDETYRILGVSRETFVPSMENYLRMVHPDDQATVLQLQGQVRQGLNPEPMEYRIIRPDGSVRQIYRESALVRDEAGLPSSLVSTIHDITERRQTEEQLRQAQKMEAIGNLTGGMAHDFNNLLGIIIGNLDLLRDRQSDDPEAAELSGEALEAALRGADLTRRLLAFARRQPLQPARIEVNALIAGIVKLLERTLGEHIRITLDLDPATWPVVADPAQLESSLTNLATNARDAMPRGGKLTIVTGNRSLDADYASLHAEVRPGDYAMIEVSDTGTGMPPEVLNHVFEPFYTTKEQDKGTGLGLSMVFGFMKQSGGHINVYSEVGIGTTFRLYLPRTDSDAEARPAAAAMLHRGSGETVLVVEDNASLRRVVLRQLTELGYRVLEAEDAQTALQVLESEPVDLLFTDVVMPGGISGYEIAQTVLSRWPSTRVVLTSGFPETRIDGDPIVRNLRLLSKPYRRDDLGRLIREVLDS